MKISQYARKHEWKRNVDGYGTDKCIHCNSRTGIGFHFIMECALRFNEEGFKEFLSFNNIGVENGVYSKRYTNITYTREELMKRFKQCANEEADKKVLDEKYVVENVM